MACRILNMHSEPLRIDLRGGDVLLLQKGEQSQVLHEELLYDNDNIAQWQALGWLSVVPARMRELRAQTAASGKTTTTGATTTTTAPARAPGSPRKKKTGKPSH